MRVFSLAILIALTSTTIFFERVFALDVTTSTGVTVTATVDAGSGGGGGGGGIPTGVTFLGRAYPLSRVSLLKDGAEVLSTISGPDAKFNFSITGLSSGTYTFSILSEDDRGRRSTLFTIPVMVTYGTSATISGIFLSPTIDIDKREVKKGDSITIFGKTAPDSVVTIAVHSLTPHFAETHSDENGAYIYNFNTAPLEYGLHDTKSKSELKKTNEVTSYSKALTFTVGDKNLDNDSLCPLIKGDFNDDCKVNLIDFSIIAYWYKKKTFPPKIDLNKDGKITFVDFSIMAYYWTG